jgi:hypothetical protein
VTGKTKTISATTKKKRNTGVATYGIRFPVIVLLALVVKFGGTVLVGSAVDGHG